MKKWFKIVPEAEVNRIQLRPGMPRNAVEYIRTSPARQLSAHPSLREGEQQPQRGRWLNCYDRNPP